MQQLHFRIDQGLFIHMIGVEFRIGHVLVHADIGQIPVQICVALIATMLLLFGCSSLR